MSQVPQDKLLQARFLMDQGRHEEAKASLLRLLQRSPSDPTANVLMCMVLSALGQGAQAIFYGERATAASPASAETWLALGLTQLRGGSIDKGIDNLRRATRVNPLFDEAWLVLGETLRLHLRYVEAAQVYREADKAIPASPQITANLALTLHTMGRTEDALKILEGAAPRHPREPGPTSALAMTLNYDPSAGPERVFAAQCQVESTLRRAGLEALPPLQAPRGPDRRLRVGVLSAEFSEHSVAYFLEPLLERLDPDEFELVAYSATLSGDPVAARFRKLMPRWHDVQTAQGPGLASKIRADGIDILIETTGTTNAARLVALFLRAAPIQVTCLGYPASTGLSNMDLRIVDSLTDPPGADAYATERLVRLDPCFLCYRPAADIPAVSSRDPGAPLTFGSFNTLMKLSDPLIRLWSRIVQGVPGSRLMLKSWALREPGTAADLRSRFAAAGCSGDQLELVGGGGSRAEHLARYNEVDVALDTFPYHGTTTTCEAFVMGVPVVTQEGKTHASRVGLTLLNAVGLNDLVARHEEAYFSIATSLMRDRARLAELRQTLRGRMLASPLCDEAAYAARFGAALREAWRRACAAG